MDDLTGIGQWGNPSCHVCGAVMTPQGHLSGVLFVLDEWMCLSCGATTTPAAEGESVTLLDVLRRSLPCVRNSDRGDAGEVYAAIEKRIELLESCIYGCEKEQAVHLPRCPKFAAVESAREERLHCGCPADIGAVHLKGCPTMLAESSTPAEVGTSLASQPDLEQICAEYENSKEENAFGKALNDAY